MTEIPRTDLSFALIPEWVLYGVSPRALQLYAILSRHADYDTGESWPSQSRLAELAHCSDRTIRNSLHELLTVGALTITSRFDQEGGQKSNLYTVLRSSPLAVDFQPPPSADFQDPLDADFRQNENHLEREPIEPSEANAPAMRKRDLLWEAFCTIHGDPASPGERGKYNRAVRLLRDADVTPDEYPLLVAAYMSKHTRQGSPAPQPAPTTVANRIGEMRHYVQRGPIQGRDAEEVASAQRWQKLKDEHGRKAIDDNTGT